MIREATVNDAGFIAKLSSALGYKSVSNKIAQDRLKTILESENQKVWISENEDKIQGWIHVFIANRIASQSFVEIGGLVVSTDFQRNGIGSDLVEHAQKWANKHELTLRVRCNGKRKESHIFYQAIGFLKSKEQNVYEVNIKNPAGEKNVKTSIN